jgi:phage-related protein
MADAVLRIVRLFDFDLSTAINSPSNTVHRLTPYKGKGKYLTWRGNEYSGYTGIELSNLSCELGGKSAEPTLSVFGADPTIRQLLSVYEDPRGIRVNRWTVDARHLDDGSDPDPEAGIKDSFYIDFMESLDLDIIRFRLSGYLGLERMNSHGCRSVNEVVGERPAGGTC